jgi:hypothetical protein
MSAYEQRLISEEKVIEELNAKGIFSVTLDESDIGILDELEDLRDDLDGAMGGTNSIAKNPEERPQVGRDTGDPGGSNPLNKKTTSPPIPKQSKSGSGANLLGADKAHDEDTTERLPTKNSQVAIQNFIRKKGAKWVVISHEGKQLGEYDDKEDAEKRLQQIEYFKSRNSALDSHDPEE